MKFVFDIEKERYEGFVKSNVKSHFLQSYAWGEFSSVAKGLTPHYVGVTENDKLIATALLLQKKLPLGYSYFYCPRGFVVDYYDINTLRFLTEEIKKYTKKYKSIFTKIDPDIIWSLKDNDYNEKSLPYDSKVIFNNIKSLGFKHKGFTKNFETMQPRYTFRIDMNQSLEEIESKFSKTTKQRIKKATNLDTKVRIGDINDIEKFSELMLITEARKNFLSYDLDYYKKLYEIYNKDNLSGFNLIIRSGDQIKDMDEEELYSLFKSSDAFIAEWVSSDVDSVLTSLLNKHPDVSHKELFLILELPSGNLNSGSTSLNLIRNNTINYNKIFSSYSDAKLIDYFKNTKRGSSYNDFSK